MFVEVYHGTNNVSEELWKRLVDAYQAQSVWTSSIHGQADSVQMEEF